MLSLFHKTVLSPLPQIQMMIKSKHSVART